MSKKIIVLKRLDYINYFEVSYVFWLAVPVSQQTFRANPTATSVYSGASTAENQAIQAGQIYEYVGKSSYTSGTAIGQVGSDLVTKYNNAQTSLNGDDEFQYFGTYWDGTSWTVQGG